MSLEDPDEPSFFQEHRVGLVVTLVVLGLAGFGIFKYVQSEKGAPRRAPELVMIKLPPPPPPPPTPPQQPTPEEKLVDEHEQKIDTPDQKPKDEPQKPPDEPPIGTGIKGDGAGDSFGLTGSTGNGFGGGGGSRFDWYAGQIQRTIANALRSNSATRQASLSVKVRVWADPAGRISRVELLNSSGDSSLDEALRTQVLPGLQVSEGPPDGMPMPVVLRLTERRPQ